MPYVVGEVEVHNQEGRMCVTVRESEIIEGPRPTAASEIKNCHVDVLEQIKSRSFVEGETVHTPACIGTGVALILQDIRRLHWPAADSPLMGHLRDKTKGSELFDADGNIRRQKGLIGPFRDGEANDTFWCADICAGLVETANIFGGAFHEAIEVGFHLLDPRGKQLPARLTLKHYHSLESILENALVEEWTKILGHKPRFYHTIPAQMVDETKVYFDCVSHAADSHKFNCIVSADPKVGIFKVIVPVSVDLTGVAGGWRVRDTEHKVVEGRYVALNRPLILIVPSEIGKPPIMLTFGPDGLDPSRTIAYLEGSNLETMINDNVRVVLNALGWIKE